MSAIDPYRPIIEQTHTATYQELTNLIRHVEEQERVEYMPSMRGDINILDRMHALLRLIDFSADWFDRVILVAGTSGKGSVVNYLQQALGNESKTGAFYSPAVLSWCEVVQPSFGQLVTPEDLLQTVKTVVDRAKRHDFSDVHGFPSYFEVLVIAALVLCKNAGCSQMILEVGCGGREDATNAVPHGITLLTTVGEDHIPRLGNTMGEIAREKAGAFAEGGRAFVGDVDPDIKTELTHCAQASNCALKFFEAVGSELQCDYVDQWNQKFVQWVCGELGVPSAADTQFTKPPTLPGRYDHFLFGRGIRSSLIVDGAHNPQKIGALVKRLRHDGVDDATIYLAAKGGKDIVAIAKQLEPFAYRFKVCQATTLLGSNTKDPSELVDLLAPVLTKPVEVVEDFDTDFESICRECESGESAIVTGSFALVARTLGHISANQEFKGY